MPITISGTTGIDAGSLPVNNCGNTEVEGALTVAGNVGIGATPSAWRTTQKVIEIAGSGALSNFNGLDNVSLCANMYINNSNQYVYKNNGYATIYSQSATHTWGIAPSGTAGNVINMVNAMTLDNNGNLLLQSGTGGIGYGTGAGGTVTQLTSKSTSVTLNKPSGRITMNNSALAAGSTVSFIFYNNLMGASDTLTLSIPNLITNDVGNYRVVHNLWNGGALIIVTNTTGSTLSESISINFNLHKGASA